jgi:CheY-like chemotaxis protein
MNYTDGNRSHKLAPYLRRVLLLDASPANARMMSELLKGLGAGRISTATSEAQAMETCRYFDPQLIITEWSGPMFEGLRFTKALRHSSLSCREAPVIMVTAEATMAAILGARNAGVHEFLRKPFALRALTRRIEVATVNSRDWIEAVNYVGPDRRRFNSGDYRGLRKRRSDSEAREQAERIEQALKILKSALGALQSDPTQARRSIRAQAADLHAIAVRTNDLKLVSAVAPLQRALISTDATGALSGSALEAASTGLWAFMPEGVPAMEGFAI